MGGGHLGAATELARLLGAAGYAAPIVDLLDLMRFGYGRFITGFYRIQLRYAPWSYQAIYSLWRTSPRLVRAANGTDTRMSRRGLLEVVEQYRPDSIISTYNLGAQVLGELSADGSLRVPVYSFVTDFGVHPYWIHEAIDGYLVVHESSARRVEQLSAAPVKVCGPLVSPRFTNSKHTNREATRQSLGLAATDIAALVVAGAWGVGDIEQTVAELRLIEGCVPIVVCGNNHRLAAHLRRSANNENQIVGFTDAMPALMSAADVLVENAGGLTCSEAFASDLPVITYRPIPAHGIDNANAMAAARVTTFAHNRRQLHSAVTALGRAGDTRSRQVSTAHAVFRGDPTATVLKLIEGQALR